RGDDDDGVRVAAVGDGAAVERVAHEGRWRMGSDRSEGEECFWSWPENSPEKLFRRRVAGDGGGGRRQGWPAGGGGVCV
nr:hypothetical protein [Tanacetum cinerariifolium]